MSKKFIAILCALSLVFTQIAAISVTAADRTAPALRAATPKMNSTGISTTVKISLKFSENLYKSKYFTKIKLAKSSGSATTITRSIYKNYLKIGHKYGLSYSTTYYLTVPAYSVKDKAGNILKKKIVVKFKTKAKPVTPSPSPVVTPTPTATPVVDVDLNSSETYLSSVANADFTAIGAINMTKGQMMGFPSIGTGIQRLEFDVTPLISNVNGSINIGDGTNAITGASNMAITLGLNATGTFECNNGDTVTDSALPYVANTAYHVLLIANMDSAVKTYSVWVTPAGGSATQIATDFAFKSTSDADDMGKLYLVSAAGGDMQFTNITKKAVYTPGKSYSSISENEGWVDSGLFLGNDNTGLVTITYDAMTTMLNADASVDFADSNTEVGGFDALSILIRFNDVGVIDCLDELKTNFHAVNSVPYVANTKYSFRVVADMTAKTFSAWVTPDGGVETQIASGYKFRITANTADDIGQVFVVNAWESGRMSMSNLTISHA